MPPGACGPCWPARAPRLLKTEHTQPAGFSTGQPWSQGCPQIWRYPLTSSKVSPSHRGLNVQVTIVCSGALKTEEPLDHLNLEAVAYRRQSAPTMTSLELVEFINADRKSRAEAAGAEFPSKGFAKLEHADFMKKVPEVLGPNAGNFSCVYLGGNGQERPCYRFPKREACLMAMSTRPAREASVLVTGALPICFAIPRPATRAAPTAAATGLGLSCHGGKQNSQQAPTKLPALHCFVPSLPV